MRYLLDVGTGRGVKGYNGSIGRDIFSHEGGDDEGSAVEVSKLL